MKYTSKYIEKILTSSSAKRGLDYITPIYHEAYAALWIMQVMGVQVDTFFKWIEEFQHQLLPQTATWALSYWEEEYGIITNTNLSLEERQRAVLLAVRTRAPMNPKKLAHILSLSVNSNIEIIENTAKNTFSIISDDVLNIEQDKKVKNILSIRKPAHLIYEMQYKPKPIYTGICFISTITGTNINTFLSEIEINYDFNTNFNINKKFESNIITNLSEIEMICDFNINFNINKRFESNIITNLPEIEMIYDFNTNYSISSQTASNTITII